MYIKSVPKIKTCLLKYSDIVYKIRDLMLLVPRITPKSRAKVCAQWRMSLSPPGSLLATKCSKAVALVYFLLNVFGVGV